MNPIDLGDVDVFTAGAVGQPGQRVFYLQARRGGSTANVKCEKQHVMLLGDHLGKLLEQLPPVEPGPPAELPFIEPRDALFVLGPIGVAVDEDDDRIVLQLEEVKDTEDDEEEDESTEDDADDDRSALRVSLTRDQASAFCRRAAELVAAGRPTCRWCGRSIDADGHLCPTMN
jgi:uncharacterized repeat protein (TIGR03847 family)